MSDTDTTVLDVLKGARELVAKGWTQGAFQRGGCYCALGAIIKAAEPVSEARLVAEDEAVRHLQDLVGNYVDEWNDEDYRTQDEVVAAFDKAIERVESGTQRSTTPEEVDRAAH